MCRRIGICILCFSFLALFSGIGLCAGEKDEKAIVLIGARLIDGTQRPPVENAVLVIEGDKLTKVGPAGSAEYPGDAQVIDCHGQTIIPGLISDHSHLGLVDGVLHLCRTAGVDKREFLSKCASTGVARSTR